MVIPTDSRYVPLTQQKWCCVPTCIQMVMYRHNLPLIPAELIGCELGLTVPKSEIHLFWNARTGKEPKAGWGTRIGEKKFEPNAAFKRLKILLRMDLKLIYEFPTLSEFKTYLEKVEKDDLDVLTCFDWQTLFGEGNHGGHVCVLDKVFLERGEVRIIDPEFKSPKWRIVKLDKLYEAMKFHGKEKSGGFWELRVQGTKK